MNGAEAARLSRREVITFRPRSRPSGEGHFIRVHRRAMACRFEVTLHDEDAAAVPAAREALAAVERVEDALTVFRESEVTRVNREAAERAVPVGAELAALLSLCRELHVTTEGAFDPTSTPLSRCWGFLARAPRIPSDEEVEAARSIVGFERVELDRERRTVRFARPGMELNFGSIGKGWALDFAAERLRARGAGRALLSGGSSSVLALGEDAFDVDLRSPRRAAPLARLHLRGAALGTSGAGVQFLDAGGRRYGHVIDPRTGRPSEGVLSASVVAPSAAVADALSTAFLVGGPALAERYCAAHPGVLVLLTLEDQPEPRVVGSSPEARLETYT
jgi:thiamine biosynthesis lipoprotein